MEELKKKLIAICNESELPLEAILFVTKDLWRDVDATIRSLEAKEQTTIQKENKGEIG